MRRIRESEIAEDKELKSVGAGYEARLKKEE